MAQVHGNPEEIRAFAQVLAAFCQEARDRLGAVESRLRDMGDSTWSDQRYREFAAQFEQAATGLRRGLDEIEPSQVQYLHQIARMLEEYERG